MSGPFTFPQPSEKRRSNKRIVITVVVAVLSLCCVGAVGGGFLIVRTVNNATEPARAVATDYAEALRTRNYAAAYALTCESTREFSSQEAFASEQAAQLRIIGFRITGSTIENRNGRPTATIRMQFTHNNGEARDLKVVVVEEGGEWRVCD